MKKILVVISILLNVAFLGYVSRRTYFKLVQLPVYEAKERNREEKTKSHLPPDFFLKWSYRLFESLPSDGHPVIFVGDSHTAAFRLDEYFPDKHILNRGIGGDTTGGVLRRILEVTKRNPSKIFICIGINDIARDKVPRERIVSNYLAILEKIRKENPSANIYLQSVMPISNIREARIGIKEFNKFVSEQAKKRDAVFIDLYPIFQQGDSLNPKYDSGDGVHLSAEGYRAWSKIVKPYL